MVDRRLLIEMDSHAKDALRSNLTTAGLSDRDGPVRED